MSKDELIDLWLGVALREYAKIEKRERKKITRTIARVVRKQHRQALELVSRNRA